MGHREDIRTYLESLTVEDAIIIDWGSGSKPVQKYINHIGCEFIRIDQNHNDQWPPTFLWDIEKHIVMPYKADCSFCMEVLEHTTDPQMVFQNIYDNLKVGGTLHLSVPFLYPEHGEEDYLRFTRHGLRYYAEQVGFKDINIWEIEQGYLMEATK